MRFEIDVWVSGVKLYPGKAICEVSLSSLNIMSDSDGGDGKVRVRVPGNEADAWGAMIGKKMRLSCT